MNKLIDGEIIDLLPKNFHTNEILILSYAIKKIKQKVLRNIKSSMLYAAIDTLDDKRLDLLAAELRTQYYEKSLPIEIKRTLVRSTLNWYYKAGTPSVIKEFLSTIYDGGVIEEWFEYGGLPYHFRVTIDLKDSAIDPVQDKKIRVQINKLKNSRSVLEIVKYRIISNFVVPVNINCICKICSSFYPRRNTPYAYMDSGFSMDGSRRMNGYDDSHVVDFYPVVMTVKMRMEHKFNMLAVGIIRTECSPEITFETLYKIRMGIQNQITTKNLVKMICDVKADSELCSQAHIVTPVRCQINIDVRTMHNGGILAPIGVKKEMLIHIETKVAVNNETKVTVEKSYWKLDGSVKLDGSRKMNAEKYDCIL